MWHYTIDNTPQNPVVEAVIAQLIANGTIHANTLVWREGMTEWLPLASTELAHYANPQPQSPLRSPVGPVAVPPNRQAVANPYAPPQSAPRAMQQAPAVALTWKHILWSFEGRIPRRSYWAGIGIWIGLFLGVALLAGLIAPLLGKDNEGIAFIPVLFFLIPYFWSIMAMQVKRWHDRDKSGWMVLVSFIPIVGPWWALIECGCLRGTMGPNNYGQDPT